MLNRLRELKLFYYIYCDALINRAPEGSGKMAERISKQYLILCDQLQEFGSPKLTYQTDPRWKTADNRRKKGKKDADIL